MNINIQADRNDDSSHSATSRESFDQKIHAKLMKQLLSDSKIEGQQL